LQVVCNEVRYAGGPATATPKAACPAIADGWPAAGAS
jgi:hypothetical protein